jgi:hypothetical protein
MTFKNIGILSCAWLHLFISICNSISNLQSTAHWRNISLERCEIENMLTEEGAAKLPKWICMDTPVS